MNRNLLRLYHRLPGPLQGAAASYRGLQLRRWRYGPETEPLVEAALERESWSPRRWSEWRDDRTARLLHRAARSVPYYRQLWEERRRAGNRVSPEILENWPLLEKAVLRERPREFVAEDCDTRRMFHEHTSGTTGTPLYLWWSRATVREWYALFECRIRRWNGVSRHDRWAILGGQPVIPGSRSQPPFWVWNAGLHQLYLSSYHLRPQTVASYMESLRRHRVVYIFGYASALAALAHLALAAGLKTSLRVAVSNAEPLFDSQRSVIGEAFGCPVRNTYGMAEIVAAATECPFGVMHEWPEVGITEVFQDDVDESAPSGTGRLVCTGLLNMDMPLIRYVTGDRGARPSASESCECGRRLPRFGAVEGRSDDVVYTPDGRRVGRLDPVFKADLGIREAQIVQETLDLVHVYVVSTPRFGTRQARIVTEGLRDRLGPEMKIVLHEVSEIERTDRGKFRAVVSRISNPLAGSRT